jgi:hypothetical protein
MDGLLDAPRPAAQSLRKRVILGLVNKAKVGGFYHGKVI